MFHIKSSCPALITIDKDYLLENAIDKVDIKKQNLIIKYYPLDKSINGKTAIPSIVKINQEAFQNTKEYSIINYPNNHTEILLKPLLIHNFCYTNKNSYKIENSNDDIEINTSKTTTFILKTDSCNLYYTYPSQISFSKAIYINDTYHILLQNNTVYMQIKNGKITVYDDIKQPIFEQNKFRAIIPNYDMAKSGKAIEINFSKPYSFDEKDIYIDDKPKLITNEKLIPYAFLEAVRSKNYNLARHYVSKSMQAKLTDDVLCGFFENIQSISHDIYNDKVCIISQQKDIFIAKDYSFDIQNGKIINIMQL